jgi:hypothetical protein
MKDMGSAFRTYLNKEEVYVSQAALGLVDASIIGVFLQANPTLTFRDDLKEAIMEAMSDATPISIFPKRVKEPSNDKTKNRFTNGLAIQVVTADPKKAGEYTEILSKAKEYFNENGCHPILSSKVFLRFDKSAAIDNKTFRKLIRMKNEHLSNIKNVEMHHLCHIDKEISFGYDTTGEPISSTIWQMLMDEVGVEGDTIFHSIRSTMKADTNRALFLKPNNDLCMAILEGIEGWLAQKFEHSDDPTAYRDNDRVKVIMSTTEQRKSQRHVQFGAHAKRMVKKYVLPTLMRQYMNSTMLPPDLKTMVQPTICSSCHNSSFTLRIL